MKGSVSISKCARRKKITAGNTRKFIVNFTCFGYADVIKYQEKPTISCERADYYSWHHQHAHGHKTIGSTLILGLTDLRTFVLTAGTHGATLGAAYLRTS